MSIVERIHDAIFPPLAVDISSSVDWTKIPFGFFRIIANNRESLGCFDSVFGIMCDVKQAFNIGLRKFHLDCPVSALPIARVHAMMISQPGVAHVNGRVLIDTETFGARQCHTVVS